MKEHQNNQHSIFFKREWGGELLFFSNLNVVKKKKKERKKERKALETFLSQEVKETQLNATPNTSLDSVLEKGKNSIEDIPRSTDKNRKQPVQ